MLKLTGNICFFPCKDKGLGSNLKFITVKIHLYAILNCSSTINIDLNYDSASLK